MRLAALMLAATAITLVMFFGVIVTIGALILRY